MDLHRIDLNLLVAFDALMKERSVTRAGARIGISQPAMSAALARLRRLLGDDLFVRASSGLHPTPRAIDIEEHVREALQRVETALGPQLGFEPRRAARTLTLGMNDYILNLLLPLLVPELRAEAPGIVLRARNYLSRNKAITLLDEGAIDAAVGYPVPTSPRILSRPLFEERLVCVARQDHPDLPGRLDLEQFARVPQVVAPPEDEGDTLEQRFGQLGIRSHVVLVVPQMLVLPAVVENSDLIAILGERQARSAATSHRLQILELPFRLPPSPISLLWHRRTEGHPAQDWFRALVGRIASGLYGRHDVPELPYRWEFLPPAGSARRAPPEDISDFLRRAKIIDREFQA